MQKIIFKVILNYKLVANSPSIHGYDDSYLTLKSVRSNFLFFSGRKRSYVKTKSDKYNDEQTAEYLFAKVGN